ncbi:TonB-dependent receptor [Salegentibacter sp. JZCK2]|uniref:TonB-dependent receptor n=1 Tax=Salegentibacter tibetensis TaxID=2873600 RepID=UPI001CC98FD4|nr:TonB-dependent receptor [Salegentibacter tibetensis]MBZ9729940.1 TonB-dependent receptor [Salegentibacter tibetensis]
MVYTDLKLYFIIFFLGWSVPLMAQSSDITGKIYGSDNKPLLGINILIPEINKGTVSDKNGEYHLKNLRHGSYSLKVTGLGFSAIVKNIEIIAGKALELDFYLQESLENLGEVAIIAKNRAENLRESAYEVSVIETAAYKNLSGDLTSLLKTTPGINIRETGGLGSDFNLSLNGLSGNQIRFFIDGVPMENFGSSISLNNFPVNLIKDIQVYKGVVPISLGADALGGAVNITTETKRSSFLDASYSLGSFNTKRAAVNGQYTNEKSKYYVRLITYFNHSDNDFEMKSVPLYDLELGNYFGEISTKRFHSAYTSGMAKVQTGIFDRTWADEIVVSLTWSGNRNNQQHPSNNINRVFGDFHTKNENILADIKYKKQFDKLGLSAHLMHGKIEQQTIDTSAYRYNWIGEKLMRSNEDMRGELFDRRSFIVLNDEVLRSNVQLDYEFNQNHSLIASVSQNSLQREGYDKVNEFNTSIEFPNSVNKYIIAAGYDFSTNSKKWKVGAFVKQYVYDAEITTKDFQDNIVFNSVNLDQTGFGITATHFLSNTFQLKSSFEKAIRLPEAYEILGDGVFTNPNPQLNPEESENFNLGFRYKNPIGTSNFRTEGNFFLRNSTNFIRFRPMGPFGQFENINNVRTLGGELSNQIVFNRIQLDLNATYQHITDQTETDEGLPNVNFESRVPNIPYLFGNLRIGYDAYADPDIGVVNIYWNSRYVHEFFLNWENLGNADTKPTIPAQLANDLELEFSSPSRRYNMSFTAANIFDTALYDNFRIQKPGRAFYFKIRYNLN